jgi:hypothetical protein
MPYHRRVHRDRLPPALLAAYAAAFGWRALGGGLLIFDDHPGQLYRLAHALTLGPAPWRLNPGWWGGYAELQFYPPGFAWLGAAVHALGLGALSLAGTYRLLLWLAWLLPGVATYLLLSRVMGSAWLALPGAFVALTLSAGSRSGVEEGLRWGLVASRLGSGLLPLLALSLLRWSAGASPHAPWAAPLLAAIILMHPAHAPAGVLLVALAAWARSREAPGAWRDAALIALSGTGLAAVWLLPLLAHLSMALPLAWGDASLAGLVRPLASRPLILVMATAWAWVAWPAGRLHAPSATGSWLVALFPTMAVLVLLDALVAQPLGMAWLPADRLLDSFLLALVLGASLALSRLRAVLPAFPEWGVSASAVVLAVSLAWGHPEPALSLWPREGEWPRYETVSRGVRLEALWDALRQAPPGRALFIRSSLPLDYRPEWWRAHSHVTALAPLHAGREILNGTFTHPSPVAGLVYTGSAANRPITRLVEQRDGVTLFGLPLDAITPEAFNRLAERLRISAVVAVEQDAGRLGFVSDNPAFARPVRVGPFFVFSAREARPTPLLVDAQRWRMSIPAGRGEWMPAGMAWSPLWRATAGGGPIETRRDEAGMLEVKAPPGTVAVELEHAPGPAEWAGLAITAASALLLGLARIRKWAFP